MGIGLGVLSSLRGLEFPVKGLGFAVGIGVQIQDMGFGVRVPCLGMWFWVWGMWFIVWGLKALLAGS